LITPFVLFVFVLCIVPNAVSGLYILDYPPFVLFVFVLGILPNAVSGLYRYISALEAFNFSN
jgi:hypothetical protein